VTSLTRRFLPLVLAALFCGSATAEPQESREFAFFLARFKYLFLACTPDGYKLTFVTDSKAGETCRMEFNDFHVVSSSPDSLHLKQRFEDLPKPTTDLVELALVRLPQEHGVTADGFRNNRSINAGHWRMSFSGSGTRFDLIRDEITSRRVSEFWPDGSLDIHGELIHEYGFPEAYVRR
jgi:hypothetical protein